MIQKCVRLPETHNKSVLSKKDRDVPGANLAGTKAFAPRDETAAATRAASTIEHRDVMIILMYLGGFSFGRNAVVIEMIIDARLWFCESLVGYTTL